MDSDVGTGFPVVVDATPVAAVAFTVVVDAGPEDAVVVVEGSGAPVDDVVALDPAAASGFTPEESPPREQAVDNDKTAVSTAMARRFTPATLGRRPNGDRPPRGVSP
jgi:hypothetical protein